MYCYKNMDSLVSKGLLLVTTICSSSQHVKWNSYLSIFINFMQIGKDYRLWGKPKVELIYNGYPRTELTAHCTKLILLEQFQIDQHTVESTKNPDRYKSGDRLWGWLCYYLHVEYKVEILITLTSHLSPVQGGWQEQQKVCFSLLGKQGQLVIKHPWIKLITSKRWECRSKNKITR